MISVFPARRVLSTENLLRQSEHTVVIYFWKKKNIWYKEKIMNLQYLM